MSDTQEAAVTESAKAPRTRKMHFYVLDDGTIQAQFGEGVEPVSLDPNAIPEQVRADAVTEGLISRLRSYASRFTDAERTPENLRSAIEKGVSNILSGTWKLERGDGNPAETYTIEQEAAYLFRKRKAEGQGAAFDETIAETAELWKGLTDDQRKQVKDLPRFQACLAEVKAERQARKAERLAAKAQEQESEVDF